MTPQQQLVGGLDRIGLSLTNVAFRTVDRDYTAIYAGGAQTDSTEWQKQVLSRLGWIVAERDRCRF